MAKTSKIQRERRRQRWMLAGAIAAIVLAGGLLIAYGLTGWVLPLRQPVARIAMRDGSQVELSTAEFQARVRFERSRYIDLARQDQQAAGELADERGFGQMVLERMIRETLVQEEATQRGLGVSDNEIDQYIEQAYGLAQVAPTPESVLPASADMMPTAPSIAATAFKKAYQADLEQWARYGISEQSFRAIVGAELLEGKLVGAMGQEAFQAWLDGQQERVTWLDYWAERVPSGAK